MGRSRIRSHLAGIAAAVATILLVAPASSLAAQEFRSGVTAGEITDQTAIVWGRTNQEAQVKAQVAKDSLFQNVVRERILTASDSNDNTVQFKFGGFSPYTTYFYRFCYLDGSPCSVKGKFRTAPSPDTSKPIRFGYSGDETAVAAPGETQPYWGFFKAFKSMVAENNDFNIDFGDTIYSDPEVPGADTALGVGEKWAMYRKKLAIANMRALRSSAGVYNHWDDHEFINDFSIPENGTTLYNRGVRAFRNYMPVHFSQDKGIYRTFRWGKNLQLFFLDERSFRDAKASAGGVCDNPQTGEPDLAPTAPQNVRNNFSFLVPSLSAPVSQACKNKINDPNRSLLGKDQLNRFLYAVENSTARWKVVMNEVPMQQFYALPYDRWEGYAYERIQLLNKLQAANVDHLVFLTTDTHAAFANVVRKRTLSGDVAPANAPATTPSNTAYDDYVIGPVATTPFWQEIDEVTGQSGNGKLVSQGFFKPQPPNGMGMKCAQGGQNSYAEVTVTGTSLTIAYKDENGNILLDVNGSTPCGPYVLPF